MISWFEKHNKISLAITIFGGLAIFYISSLEFKGVPSIGVLSMIYHFSAFFCFSFFLFISFVRGKEKYSVFAISIILAILYGTLDELHQFFVPGRTCTFFDVGIDLFGILFASMIYFIKIKLK